MGFGALKPENLNPIPIPSQSDEDVGFAYKVGYRVLCSGLNALVQGTYVLFNFFLKTLSQLQFKVYSFSKGY